jgi:hypothetical protein
MELARGKGRSLLQHLPMMAVVRACICFARPLWHLLVWSCSLSLSRALFSRPQESTVQLSIFSTTAWVDVRWNLRACVLVHVRVV